MVRYFYAWTPLVIVFGTAVLLTIPYLALIALMIVALAALAAFVWAIVSVPYMLGRAISRRWQHASGASPRTAALSPDRRQNAQPVFGRGHVA